MIQYWPYEQSEDLNNEVAFLFASTKKKICNSLSNNTNQYLYIDILDNKYKYKIFSITLKELELLLLELLDFNITYQELKKLNYKLLNQLLKKIRHQITNQFKYIQKYDVEQITRTDNYSLLESDHQLLLGNLLIYLLFGSSHIDNNLFVFNNKYTPKTHIRTLLENFIIQINNLIIQSFFSQIKSLPDLIVFLNKNELCDKNYISIRTLASIKNNIIWQNLINQYINKPKIIYNSRYKIWLISTKGIINKYIYTSRIFDLKKLNKRQLFFLLIIEMQDLFIPKIEKILIILGKIILYIFINIIINSTIFLIKIILNHFNNQKVQK